MARPGKYDYWLTEEGLTLLRGWARDGYTNEQIAKNEMDISPSTFYEWMKRFPELSEAVKKKKKVYDFEVEAATQRSSIGYYVWEEDWKRNEKTGEMEVVARRKRWVKPDPTSQIYWLKNRMRDDWRDKVEHEITGKDGGAINIQQIADADIDKRIKELESKLK